MTNGLPPTIKDPTRGPRDRSAKSTVWLINHYAATPEEPGGTRHYWLAHHLEEHGWHMPIIRASRGGDARIHQHGRVTFVDLPAPSYDGNGLGRVLNMATLAAKAARLRPSASLREPDLVIGSSVHPLAAWAGLRQARRLGVPFIFEVRDLWPQTLVDFGRLSPDHPAARGLWRLEAQLCTSASAIISPLENIDAYFRSRGLPTGAIWIPNGIDAASRPVAPLPRSQHRTLMYLGAHGQANNLKLLIQAIGILEREGMSPDALRVRLYGDGPLKTEVQQSARSLGLRCVEFHAPVPSAAVPEIAAEADAFVLPLMDQPRLWEYGFSANKLYEYMAAGRPTILTLRRDNPVSSARSGWVTDPTPHSLATAIRAFVLHDAQGLAQMGQRARVYVEQNHDHARLAGRLANVLAEVAPRAAPGVSPP